MGFDVDWCEVRPSGGDQVCPRHGIVTPADGLVPHCPEMDERAGRPCQRIVWGATSAGFVEPRPGRCGRGHVLELGRFRLGTSPCRCVPAGHHRTWHCLAVEGDIVCGDVLEWPPHDASKPRAR
jgi:hypothetical protein